MQIFKFLLLCTSILLAAIIAFLLLGWSRLTKNVTYGMTFSRPYAEELGLNPRETLTTALDDVGIRHFRISAYWKLIEKEEGVWNFAELDQDIAEIGKRGGHVTLAVGNKLPRWPECWTPDWVKTLPTHEQQAKTLVYLNKVMTRYQKNPIVAAWQIENEPYFAYGDCPTPDKSFIQKEIEHAQTLDTTRPIYTTDSGELSFWTSLGSSVDALGVSVYRIVRNPLLGNLNWHYWFLPPYFYQRKALLLRPFGLHKIYVSEFQMEPWSNKPLAETAINDQLSSMNLKQMKKNFAYASRMGIQNVDFWGVEWWIWMKDHGHPEFIEEAKRFWQTN